MSAVHNCCVGLALNLTDQSISRGPRSRWKGSPCFRVPGFRVRSGGWGRTHRPQYIHVIESKQTSFCLWPSPWLVQPAHSGMHSSPPLCPLRCLLLPYTRGSSVCTMVLYSYPKQNPTLHVGNDSYLLHCHLHGILCHPPSKAMFYLLLFHGDLHGPSILQFCLFQNLYCMLMFLWVMLWGKELLVFTDPWTNLAMLDRSFLEIPEGTVCWIMPLSSWLSIWLCQRPLRGITEVIWTELSRNQTYMCGINLKNRDFHYFVICDYKSLSLSPSKIIFKDSAIFWVEKLCQIG